MIDKKKIKAEMMKIMEDSTARTSLYEAFNGVCIHRKTLTLIHK